MNDEATFAAVDPTHLRRCQTLLKGLATAGDKVAYLRKHLQEFDRNITQVLTLFGEVCQEIGDYASASQTSGLLRILDTLLTSVNSAYVAEAESWLSSVPWQEMALALGLTGAVRTDDEGDREEWFADLLGELQDSHPDLAEIFNRFGDNLETQARELSAIVDKLHDEVSDTDQPWLEEANSRRSDYTEAKIIPQIERPIPPERLAPFLEELGRIEAIPVDERSWDLLDHQRTVCEDLIRKIDQHATPDLWGVVITFLGDAYETMYERRGNESDGSFAERAYQSALEFFQAVQSPFITRSIPGLQRNVGRLYTTMFSHNGFVQYAEQGESAYRVSLQLFADDGRWDEWASVQDGLGNLYATIYERMENASYADAAIAAYRSALDVRNSRSDRHQLGDTENHLAIVYQQMYRKTHLGPHARKAEAGFQRALDLCDSRVDSLGWARIRNNLGLLYADMYLYMGGEHYAEEASKAYDDALTGFTRDKDPLTWAGIQSNLALLFAFRYRHNPENHYAQASADAYQQVLEVFSPESAPARAVAPARSLALIYLHLERWRNAHDAFAVALRAAHNLYRASPGGPEHRQHVAEYARLSMWDARCILHMGDPAVAWGQMEAGRTLQLFEAIGLEEAAYAREGEKGIEQVRKVRRKAQEAEARLVAVDDPQPRSILANIIYQDILTERKQARKQLEDAYVALNKLVKEMGLEAPTIKAEELPGLSLPSSAAAITIVLTVEETTALVLHDGRIMTVPLPQFTAGYVYELVNAIPTETIAWCEKHAPQMAVQLTLMRKTQVEKENEEKLGTPLRAEVTYQDSETKPFERNDDPLAHTGWLIAHMIAFDMPGSVSSRTRRMGLASWQTRVNQTIKFLADAFWKPILDALPSYVNQVLLAPSGATALLPLHAAVSDRITVAYIPSLSVWRACQNRTLDRTKNSFFIANPSNNLEFAQAETQWLHNRFEQRNWSITPLLGDQATVSAVCSGMKSVGLIHYAGHANYNWSNPVQSALHCADGKLTLTVIRQSIDLRSTRLVTLSACESGISDTSTSAEEFLGLPAILMEAGAPAIVASLWPAPDVSTAFLMDRFYEKWLNGKGDVTIADALREAVVWLRSATKDEFLHRIDDSDLSVEKQAHLKQILEPLDSVPFADPLFWAVFAAYGAVL